MEELRRLGEESGIGLGITLSNSSSPSSASSECFFPLTGSHSESAGSRNGKWNLLGGTVGLRFGSEASNDGCGER